MKRQLSLILAALLCLSMLAAMVACDNGDKPADTTAAETDAPTEAAQPEATKAPEVETKPEEPAKKSGCGAVISGSAIIVTAILAVPVFIRRKRK